MSYAVDIFADHIELEVDLTAGIYRLDVRVVEGIGNDGDIEPGLFYVEDGEADAIEADGAFFYHEPADFFGEFEA